MSIHDLSRRLAIAGIEHTVVVAANTTSQDFGVLVQKVKEFSDTAKKANTDSRVWDKLQDQDIQVLANKILEHGSDLESEPHPKLQEECKSALQRAAFSLFGHVKSPTGASKADKALAAKLRTWYELELKYIKAVADAQTTGDFVSAVKFAVKSIQAHHAQYLSYDESED